MIANATKAKELLGWETTISLDKGLKTFIAWYGNYGLEERIKL